MGNTSKNLFIDAVVIKGEGRKMTVSIKHKSEDGQTFEPFDLSNHAIKFKILGSATADAKVLVEHLITTNSEPDVDGNIYNPEGGEFSFIVTKEDTNKLGLGNFPICLDICDVDSLEHQFLLGEGGERGEFDKIRIVQV